MMSEIPVLDGYWLPAGVRERVLSQATWEVYYLKGGRVLESPEEGVVGIRWPRLDDSTWQVVLESLKDRRCLDTRTFLYRWQMALETGMPLMAERLPEFLPLLAAATGYSSEMVMRAFLSGALIKIESLIGAMGFAPRRGAALGWQSLPGLGGKVRFFPQRRLDRVILNLSGQMPFYRPAPPSALALGFAAGNVPGTAFLISLLAGLANTAHDGMPAPALLVRNSRHEPLFAPWLLSILEQFDAELTSFLGVLIWDYEDHALQARLMRTAGLMLAAAGDDTIAALDGVRLEANPGLRFHRHGHKASFSVISQEFAQNAETARQAALDASLWDQNGCLSSRVHFVEGNADAYAGELTRAMRELTIELPRGTTPRRFSHRAYDTFYSLQVEGKVQVLTEYHDDCVVVLDRRPWECDSLRRIVNACQGRTVIVRPVDDLSLVPNLLGCLPSSNLQTIGIACPPERVEGFATAAGATGVTSLRTLGQAAFPQLAFSWDGYLPQDAAYIRPAGHWTGVEM
jgi:hypothetical protein